MAKLRIKVINPNTTQTMTDAIGAVARAVVLPTSEVVAVSPSMGPVSIEGHYDEAMSALGVLDEVIRGEADGFDAYVIACFGDPGLLAAREVARGPVIGIAEAAMHVASMISNAFSVVTTLDRTVAIAEHLVEQYGMTRFCRNIRGTEIAVLDLERPGTAARRQIIDECRRAIKEDRAEAIVLGCAGMAELADEISMAIGAPVIEGVRAAVKLAEGFVQLGVSTSKRGSLAYPLAKPYSGMLSAYAPKDIPQKNAAGR